MPCFTAAVFLLNTFYITRLPKAPHDQKTADERRVRIRAPEPMRYLGWLVTASSPGCCGPTRCILNLVIPLWLVEETDAPWVVLAFLFGTNTVMCIFLPMAAARGVKDTRTRAAGDPASRRSSSSSRASSRSSTHETVGWVTIALFFLGHVTLTGAELFLSAASWTFEAELMDPAAAASTRAPPSSAAPWAGSGRRRLHLPRDELGRHGWLIIAALITVAAAALHPSTAWPGVPGKHVPADVLADAAAHEGRGRRAARRSADGRAARQPGAPGAPSGAVGPGA